MGEARAYPPIVFFGEVEPDKEVVREIIISPTKNNRLNISKIENRSKYLSIDSEYIEREKKYKIKTKLLCKEKNITIKEKLHVYTVGKTKPSIEIPVFARIVGCNQKKWL